MRILGSSALMLMAVAVASRSTTAARSLLFYLAAYAVTNLAAFAVVAALPQARAIADYRGLARQHPGLAAVLVVSLLGLVGTPPTAVFLAKLQVFTTAIDGGYGWLTALAAANTVASLFYYLRWLAPAVSPAPGKIHRLMRASKVSADGEAFASFAPPRAASFRRACMEGVKGSASTEVSSTANRKSKPRSAPSWWARRCSAGKA